MAQLSEKAKRTLQDATIIVVGLLLTFVVLMFICAIAIGGPMTVIVALLAMMGPH